MQITDQETNARNRLKNASHEPKVSAIKMIVISPKNASHRIKIMQLIEEKLQVFDLKYRNHRKNTIHRYKKCILSRPKFISLKRNRLD